MTDLPPSSPRPTPLPPAPPYAPTGHFTSPPSFSPTPPAPPAAVAPAVSRPGRPRLVAAAGLTVIASLTAGAAGGWAAAIASGEVASPAAGRTVSATLGGESLDVAGILEVVGPSVVAIDTEVTARRGPFVQRGQGAGTGVVLTAEGEILTNAHVVDGATDITVTVNGSDTALPAELVASDPSNDLALLRVTADVELTPATLGSSSELIVGDDVVAVGNALGLEGGLSVTRGIVSALGRSISASTSRGTETLDDLIQTDASISSGNSGGALVDSQGRVIGINTAVAASSGSTSAENIGFAIPIDRAIEVVDALRSAAN